MYHHEDLQKYLSLIIITDLKHSTSNYSNGSFEAVIMHK